MRWSRVLSVLCFFLALLTLACNGRRERKEVYPVRGKVLFEGKPAEGARVVFHSGDGGDERAILPHAKVGADGSFVMSTYNFEDGAPEGTYRVTVTHIQGNGPANLLPARFESPTTSGLQITVAKPGTDLEPFLLTKQPPTPKAP
jgi:hypothetical protein